MTKEETDAYLAKIRKTIAESREAVAKAELRLQETDRFLASQGLTREEVMKYKVTREDVLRVNEELRRRGLPPLQDDETAFDFDAATERLRGTADLSPEPGATGDELAERQRKFGTFMQAYRL